MLPQTSAKLMKITAWGFIGFAAVWGLAPYEPINEPARVLLDILDWPYGDAPAAISRNTMWLSSIGAGLVVAIGIMLLGIVVPALENSNKPVIRTTAIAFVAWFIVDGAGSIASGVASNVFFNSILLLAALIPLLMIRLEDKKV